MFSARTSWPRSTNRLAQAEQAARAFGSELIDLTVSNPTSVNLGYDADNILRAIAHEACLKYEPTPFGTLKNREAVAEYYARRGISVAPEDIAIVASTSEAYSFLFKLLANPGESLLVPRPSYPLFNYLADLADVVLNPYHLRYRDTEGWRVDDASLTEALDETSRGIIAVNPNNPTGSVFDARERAWIEKTAVEHELAIISDEVFLDYLYDRSAPLSGASMIGTKDALTFSLSGLSKIAGLPQMKVGWIVFSGPKELKEEARARMEIIADAYLSVSSPVARALPELLQIAEPFQERLRARISENHRTLRELTAGDDRRVTVRRSAGGWYAMLDLQPGIKEDEEWAIELIERDRVLVHPGYLYDVEEPCTLVVSTIVEPSRFSEGIKRIAARAGATSTSTAQSST